MSATVYKLFNAEGDLIYVGCSMHAAQRLAAHESKPWWPEVAAAYMEHFGKRTDALVREAALIDENRPLHNRQVADPQAMAKRQAAKDARDEARAALPPPPEPSTPAEHVAALIKRAHRMHELGYDTSATRELAFAGQIAETMGLVPDERPADEDAPV